MKNKKKTIEEIASFVNETLLQKLPIGFREVEYRSNDENVPSSKVVPVKKFQTTKYRSFLFYKPISKCIRD